MAAGLAYLEIARADPGLAIAAIAHWGLATYTIEQLGSEDQ